jgi:FtsP/CotA-like multicopper oxidase with cupredoxin domain
MSMVHPLHIHGLQFQVLERQVVNLEHEDAGMMRNYLVRA